MKLIVLFYFTKNIQTLKNTLKIHPKKMCLNSKFLTKNIFCQYQILYTKQFTHADVFDDWLNNFHNSTTCKSVKIKHCVGKLNSIDEQQYKGDTIKIYIR